MEPWTAANPDGRIVYYVKQLSPADLDYAELIQPFRSEWLIIERADTWALRRVGKPAPIPDKPAELVPPGYWPYRELLKAPDS